MEEQFDIPPIVPDHFAPIAIKLLQGVIYEEETRYWQGLTKLYEQPLRHYFGQIGLQLIVDRNEGLAFLKQHKEDQEDFTHLPRLMRKRTLNFDQSILCVLLAERLNEHTVRDSASREPVMSLREIREMVELFFRERNTQHRFLKDLKKTVEDLRGMGFLESIGPEALENEDERRYHVRRILKAFIDADSLQHLLNTIASSIDA
ncbi:MAG: DUF4194 domain-containing protein [Saprospiraceae bacterium]|nr:DUF4194 domain-containing protein [Saprospiraceae bacterium]MDZ4702841.1 DUF4194 domain-containing protein [Saprospiraceae bacterium]